MIYTINVLEESIIKQEVKKMSKKNRNCQDNHNLNNVILATAIINLIIAIINLIRGL